MDDERKAETDALLAELAARKRMREEMERENAVSAELDRITQAQVHFDNNNNYYIPEKSPYTLQLKRSCNKFLY